MEESWEGVKRSSKQTRVSKVWKYQAVLFLITNVVRWANREGKGERHKNHAVMKRRHEPKMTGIKEAGCEREPYA